MFRFPFTWIILLLLTLFGRLQAQHQHYYKSIHSDQVVLGVKNSDTADLLEQSSDFFLYQAEDEPSKVYPITYLLDADEFLKSTIGSIDNLNTSWAKAHLAELLGRLHGRRSLNNKLPVKKQRENPQELENKLADKPVI